MDKHRNQAMVAATISTLAATLFGPVSAIGAFGLSAWKQLPRDIETLKKEDDETEGKTPDGDDL